MLAKLNSIIKYLKSLYYVLNAIFYLLPFLI